LIRTFYFPPTPEYKTSKECQRSKIYTLSEKHQRTPSQAKDFYKTDTREKNHIHPNLNTLLSVSLTKTIKKKLQSNAIAPTLKRKRNVKKEVPEPTSKK
jgi:hypothetical protein